MAKERKKVIKRGGSGGIFLVTYIGAAVYFLQHTHGFWGTIWGLIEALFWPAFVVYQVLTMLHVASL